MPTEDTCDTSATLRGDLKKLELDSLYKEIGDNSTRIYAVFSVCVTATTAAVGIFTKTILESPPAHSPGDLTPVAVLLLPAMIILPCMLLISSLLHSTVRIAGYIAVFCEEIDGPRWQTRMQQLRQFRRPRYFSSGLNSIFNGLAIVSLACSILALVRLWGFGITNWLFGYAIILVISGMIFVRQGSRLRKVWSTKRFLEYQETWNDLKNWEGEGSPERVEPGRPALTAYGRLKAWWSAD